MLGQCSNSKSESSIRHKVRKLRAKVRALIPNELCPHFEKRNLLMQKINFRKTINSKSQIKKQIPTARTAGNIVQNIKFGSHTQDSLYFVPGDFTSQSCHYSKSQFQKLKPDQIQQINEDKLYYLGEKNIDVYNDYINLKNAQLLSDKKQLKYNTSVFQGKNQNYESLSLWEHSQKLIQRKQKGNSKNIKTRFSCNFRYSDHTNSMQNIFNANSKSSQQKWKTEKYITFQDKKDKVYEQLKIFKSVQQRKLQLIEEQRQKRIEQKLKIQMQMAKADANQKQIKYKQYSKIKQMQLQQQQKMHRAIKKKSILMKKGQIVKYDQQLREIMLRRKNKPIVCSSNCLPQSSCPSMSNL